MDEERKKSKSGMQSCKFWGGGYFRIYSKLDKPGFI